MSVPSVFHVSIQSRGNDIGQVATAKVQFTVDIKVAHPRFRQLQVIMDSKRVRGEADAYRYNARQYLVLVDELIENALIEIEDDISRKLGRLGSAIGVMLLLTVLCRSHWIALLPMLSAVPMAFMAYRLRKRINEIREFGINLLSGIEGRLDKTCQAAGFKTVEEEVDNEK
jgi:hypothetical protein